MTTQLFIENADVPDGIFNVTSVRAVEYTQNRCWDCISWVGRCLKEKINRIARDEACDQFSPKPEKR
jgi:hypothetical protein